MKQNYMKPVLQLVHYQASEMFCACDMESSDQVKKLLQYYGYNDFATCFAGDDNCAADVGAYIVGYCKYTWGDSESYKVFSS